MACECYRGDIHCDLSTVHHCSPSSRQAVTSGYLVQNSCCHHTHSPSHTHMSHQHISTPSHCHNCHPFTPFLTPQSHSRPSCQSQRQLLTPPPRLPHVEFSSPLGENNMIGSSYFLLVHPTAPRPNSQPDENQHFYPQNAALQVNSLDESVHASSMPQYQVQDMARQATQTAPTSAFQPVTKSEPPPLPRNMAVPVVVVEKLPTSILPKREVQSEQDGTDTDVITDDTGESQSEQDGMQSRKKEKTRQQVNCEQGSVLKSGDVAVEGAAPEKKDVPEDATLSQSSSLSGGGSGKTGRKVVVLSNWYFKVMVVGSSCVVLLQGTKADDASGMLWHSGPVVERLSSRELATKSGTVYRLEGALDQAALTEVGISDKKMTRRFKNGFPKNWLQLIEKHAMGGTEAVSATEDVSAPQEVLEVKSEPGEPKTPTAGEPESFISSPFISSLKRSSRGRVIKPSTFNMNPYLNLSDVYAYDMQGNFKGLTSPVIDLTLCEVTETQKIAKRRQIKTEKTKQSVKDRKDKGRRGQTRPQPVEEEMVKTEKTKQSVKNRKDKGRRGQTRPQPVEEKTEKTKQSVKDRKGKGRRGQTRPQPEDEREGEGDIPWSEAAVKSLKSIVHAVPAMTPNFWEIVARRLGTGHSARECNNQYLHITKKRAPKDKPTTSVSITTRLSSNDTNRKRKIQDQEFEGYTDDIFESTPFKKRKQVQVQDLSDESFDEESDGTGPIQTPSEAKQKLGAPCPLTPKLCSYLTTPDLKGGMKRETAYKVMQQIRKAKCRRGPKQPTKIHAPRINWKPPNLRSIRTGEQITLHIFEDSDSDDSIFSDTEDIITQLH